MRIACIHNKLDLKISTKASPCQIWNFLYTKKELERLTLF